MTAPLTIDEPTADVIRNVMTAARAGQFDEAREIGERGLRENAGSLPLTALLGAILVQAGDYAAALPHLEAAGNASPADPIILRNRAAALIGLERFSQALDLLSETAVASDPATGLLPMRAYAAHMDGKFVQGIADYRTHLAAHAADWEAWNNLGNALVSFGDHRGAVEALDRAAAINPRAAPTRLNLARALRDVGEADRAEAELRAMARDFSWDSNALLDLYHLLRASPRPDAEAEAEAPLVEASRRDPENVEILIELGRMHFGTFELIKARETYRTLLRIDPSNVDAYLGLAQVFEHSEPEQLDSLVAEAEKAGLADESRLDLIRAFAARRSKNYEAALHSLEAIPVDVEPAARYHLTGQMLDSLGRYDEAFSAFSAMNEAQAQDGTEPQVRARNLRSQLETQRDVLTPGWRSSWTAPPLPSPRATPVFLAGFPRSGTTLLDTMLMGHPEVAVMEERPIFRILDFEFGGFDAIADMNEDTVRAMQQRYFELANDHVDVSAHTVLVDKAPLYLHRVPQILRLFPDARFILAMRHPADALLSCFMANFRLNNSMANFLDLASGAEFYDLSFGLWERARKIFDVDVQTIFYERMVADPESELRPVADTLGLEWDPRMLDHQKTAQERGMVPTASYAQVTQPLYATSVDRWKNYRHHLEPILPVLEPWARKFGYSI